MAGTAEHDHTSAERVYASCLLHAARCLPGDPALEPADLVQQAYIKVGDRLDATRSEGEQVAYLCRAIGHVAIDHLRKVAKRPRGELSPRLRAPRDTEREALVRMDLAAALDTRGKDASRALYLALGYSCEEIAAREGITVGGVKVSISRGRQSIGAHAA